MSRQCAWAGCDAPEFARRLCETHLYPWPFERYIHGAVPTRRRMRTDGYIELEIDGLWAVEHRLIMARELGRHLLHSEVIVHLDGDRANNARDNLWLTDKSGAMKYRREHPREHKLSNRKFFVVMEFEVETDHDTDIAEVMEAVETTFTSHDSYEIDGGIFKITRATAQRGRSLKS